MAVLHNERRWPIEAARASILVAVVLALVQVSVPVQLYLPADGSWTPPPGWPYAVMTAAGTALTLAAWLATCLLPLVALGCVPEPPRWAFWLAMALLVPVALNPLLDLAFLAIPQLGFFQQETWAEAHDMPLAFTLIILPYFLETWMGPLVLIAVFCLLGRSRIASALALVATLMALAGLLVSLASDVPVQGKSLALIAAAFWLWLTAMRHGTIPAGAQPWLAALMIVWFLPEVVIAVPQVISALQIHSLWGRFDAIAAIFDTAQRGAYLGEFTQVLLILLALQQIGTGAAVAGRWLWALALVIALGQVLPLAASNIGARGGFFDILRSFRSGAIGPGAGALGLIGTVLEALMLPALAVAAIWLVRQPLVRAA